MIVLRSPKLEVAVSPEVGGKVARIRYRPSAQELLVAPRRPYLPIPDAAPWTGYDTSGMDDCFPNVDEGPYPSDPWLHRPMPQMGEWVRGSWNILRNDGERSVTLERTGFVLPYLARKTIALTADDTLRLSYEVRNAGEHGFRYLWSAHPLIAAGNRFEIRIPQSRAAFVTFPHDGARYRWPDYRGIDLSREWLPPGATAKVFLSGLSAGWCELATAGRLLRFDFDLAANPILGLWFNHYGFRGGGAEPFRCIAVEPCTTPTDVLDALPPHEYPYLPAAGSVEWSFTITVA